MQPRSEVDRTRLRVENLEARNLLSVDLQSTISAQQGSRIGPEPPDTDVSVGPTTVVETVNLSIAAYDKGSGQRLSQQGLDTFFSPLGNELSFSDPFTSYDELNGQFVVGALDYDLTQQVTRLDLAVSNDSDPADGWYFNRYDMTDGTPNFKLADYPRLGWNADAYVVSFNIFTTFGFSHVDTLSIDKSSLNGYVFTVPGGSSVMTLTPVVMHDSNPGDPMWFVTRGPGSTVRLATLSDELTDAPSFNIAGVSVPTYTTPPRAPQPGGNPTIDTLTDARFFAASMRYGQIVTADTVGTGGIPNRAVARWYQFDVTGNAPALVQEGNVDQGAGVYTYFPTVDININGDLGMTFMESSSSEFMSMYVTGLYAADGTGVMETPALVFAGNAHYTGTRAGDFSGIAIDPSDDLTFWGANEFTRGAVWATGIASFTISSDQGGFPSPSGGSSSRDPAMDRELGTALSETDVDPRPVDPSSSPLATTVRTDANRWQAEAYETASATTANDSFSAIGSDNAAQSPPEQPQPEAGLLADFRTDFLWS